MPRDIHLLRPHSHTGRVILAIATSLLAAAADRRLVAGAGRRHRGGSGRGPVLSRRQRRSIDRPPAAQGHPRRGRHRRHRGRRARDTGLPQRGLAGDRGALRVPRRHAVRAAWHDGAHRRSRAGGQHPREAARASGVRDGEEGRAHRRAARPAPAQRVPDERRQHPARRRSGGGTALHRTAVAQRRPLPLRLPDGGRAALPAQRSHGRADAVAGDAAPARRSALGCRVRHARALCLAAAGARPGLAVAPHRGPGRSQRTGRGRPRRRRRGRRRPRLHPRVPAGGRGHRGRADAVQGPAG